MLAAHLDVEARELVLGGLYSVASAVNRTVYLGVNSPTHACQECSVLTGLNPNKDGPNLTKIVLEACLLGL